MDYESYLASKGYSPRRQGAELSVPCFFDCNEPSDSSKRKLSVNRKKGIYQCWVCGVRGGPRALLSHFGDTFSEENPGTSVNERQRVLEEATTTAQNMLQQSEDVQAYLRGPVRGLTDEEIRKHRIGYVSPGWALLDAPETRNLAEEYGLQPGNKLEGRIVIPYIELGRVVQLRGKDPEGKYNTLAGDKARAYNLDSLHDKSKPVIVVEGEFDAIKLQSLMGKDAQVIALPGANTIPDDLPLRMSGYRRVFVGFDGDPAGDAGAKRFIEKFPHAVRLEWPDSWMNRILDMGLEAADLDWTNAILAGLTKAEVQGLLREAAPRRLVTVQEAAARANVKQDPGIRTGFKELDTWLSPGILPGQLMVPLAKTGVGKSLLLCNIANYNRDVPTLFVTLEMTAEETYARLAKIHRFFNPRSTDEDVYEAFKNLVICDENRMNEHQFGDLLLEFEDTLGVPAGLVFVDYLGYYARGVNGGSSYEKTSNAVMQLKGMAKEHRVAMIAPHQVSRTAKPGRPLDIDNARDSGVVEETADFLVSIYRPDDAITGTDDDADRPQPTGRLRIDVLKSRHGNAGRSTLLQMGLLSLAIVDQGSQLESLARTECERSWQGTTYESWLRERSRPVQSTMGF